MRKQVDQDGDLFLEEGEYGINPKDGKWYARCPDSQYCCNLDGHKVEEHEDGTITVSPSILLKLGDGTEIYHGHLKRGIWKRC